MESIHRQILRDNLSSLSDSTCLTTRLLIRCVETKIITRDERTKIERKGPLDDYETKSEFYDKVLKLKDLETFQKFIQLAEEDDTRQPADVLEILRKGIVVASGANSPLLLPEYNFRNKTRKDGTSFLQVPWASTSTSSNEVPPLERYKVGPTGRFALIVNITAYKDQEHDRYGAQYDSVAMATVLKILGFKIAEIEDGMELITSEELKSKISLFKEMCKMGDVCIVVIMGHGTRDNIITSEGKTVSINSDILDQFDNANFKEFIDKPKIFFFQACRGNLRDFGASTMKDGTTFTKWKDIQSNRNSKNLIIPKWTDMLVCYATLEGHLGYRETNGSWFIQILCEKLQSYGKTLEITRILILVAEQMKEEEGSGGEKQMCTWTNVGFTKQLYF